MLMPNARINTVAGNMNGDQSAEVVLSAVYSKHRYLGFAERHDAAVIDKGSRRRRKKPASGNAAANISGYAPPWGRQAFPLKAVKWDV